MLKAIEEAIRTVAEYDIEYSEIYPSGEPHWLHARGRVAQTSDHGGVRRMAGVRWTSPSESGRRNARGCCLTN